MIYVIIILSIFIGDGFIKKYIEETKQYGKDEKILKGRIILSKYHNSGAMLNFLEKQKEVVLALSCFILGIVLTLFAILLPKKENKLLKFGLSLIIGGALSNTYDRIKKGYVVDYFSFSWLKKVIFNISDICIFIGTLLASLAKR
ncbi:signal peptidase II [Mobilisporobacter senegalensis]|uniref:Lipoprotein signal peptidase n=1 Tax=Mobilisporobacter senegalensis TaxID=1329262 RepID=A0A3N1XZ59_9FIRM|nr:signal peptidase II [Mobilisporobacter senegalensis]ROR31521.1 signal peptidase II [Mobilisporobacter senegalensis]